jgi:hypothetical protein
MKTINYIVMLVTFTVSGFVLSSSSCKKKECPAPTITFTPSGTTMTAGPGEKVNLTVAVNASDNATNIKSLEVTKTSNGVTQTVFTKDGIGQTGYTYNLVDSIPTGVTIGSTFIYKFTALSDCSGNTAAEMSWTVTVGPSSARIEDSIGNNQGPRTYSRGSSNPTNPSAWMLEYKPAPTGARFASDPNSEKDIRDTTLVLDAYTANVRWGSRNGSKFKKAPGFNYGLASAKSIIDAWNNGGTALDIVPIAVNDIIIVNIKNSGRYAVVKIKSINEDGSVSSFEDYVYWEYKLAQ